MADELLAGTVKNIPTWIMVVVVFGSLVDVCQFFWLSGRWFRKLRRTFRNKLRREIMDEIERGRNG